MATKVVRETVQVTRQEIIDALRESGLSLAKSPGVVRIRQGDSEFEFRDDMIVEFTCVSKPEHMDRVKAAP